MRLWSAPRAFKLLKEAGLTANLGNAFWLIYGCECHEDKRKLGRMVRRGKLPKPPNLDMIEIQVVDNEEWLSRNCKEDDNVRTS